jgi:phosphoribosylanthranilate isomerase
MVRVKICGITAAEDARHAAACGADALGFVFFAASPRCVTPAQARAIIVTLPPFVVRVGLFVNEDPAQIRAIVAECGLDAVQLHGDEPPAVCRALPCRVIKGIRPRAAAELAAFAAYPAAALLVDAAVPGQFGGTGQRADWDLARQLAARRQVILAGGLTPDNVAEAVRQVRPYAVDVASGVERAPGHKDPEKVARFIRMAKEVNCP